MEQIHHILYGLVTRMEDDIWPKRLMVLYIQIKNLLGGPKNLWLENAQLDISCFAPSVTDISNRNHWRIMVESHRQRSHLTFTCSDSAVETLEKGRQICLKLTIKTYFTSFSSASIVDFEQVLVSWDLRTLLAISGHYSYFIPPENRQLLVLWFFQGYKMGTLTRNELNRALSMCD